MELTKSYTFTSVLIASLSLLRNSSVSVDLVFSRQNYAPIVKVVPTPD